MISSHGNSSAAHEVACRIHSLAVVAQALDSGEWESDPATLYWFTKLAESATAIAMLAEVT